MNRSEAIAALRAWARSDSPAPPLKREYEHYKDDPLWLKRVASLRRNIRADLSQLEVVILAIPSAQLQEMLRVFYKLATERGLNRVPALPGTDDYFEFATQINDDVRKYRDWVRAELRKSDLAQLIPGGRSNLPDILEAMPEPWRSIERLIEPKNYKQFAGHLVRHLDWYLDRNQPVKPPLRELSIGISILMFVAFVVLRIIGALDDFPLFSIWLFGGSGAILWVVSRFAGHHRSAGAKLRGFHHLRSSIHAAELYYYLSAAFAEDPENDGASGLIASDPSR